MLQKLLCINLCSSDVPIVRFICKFRKFFNVQYALTLNLFLHKMQLNLPLHLSPFAKMSFSAQPITSLRLPVSVLEIRNWTWKKVCSLQVAINSADNEKNIQNWSKKLSPILAKILSKD